MLTCHSEQLWQTADNRPVWRITFAGEYPPGSLGNPTARKMSDYVESVTADSIPAAIFYDLTGLNYQCGDSIGILVVGPLRRHHQEAGNVPRPVCCFWATGKTQRALCSLFKATGLSRFINAPVFGNEADALKFVQTTIPSQATFDPRTEETL